MRLHYKRIRWIFRVFKNSSIIRLWGWVGERDVVRVSAIVIREQIAHSYTKPDVLFDFYARWFIFLGEGRIQPFPQSFHEENIKFLFHFGKEVQIGFLLFTFVIMGMTKSFTNKLEWSEKYKIYNKHKTGC